MNKFFMRRKPVLIFLLFVLFQFLIPIDSFAHDTMKRSPDAEKKLYERWMEEVQHDLIDDGVLEESSHTHNDSQDHPITTAEYIETLVKTVYSKKELTRQFKTLGACSFNEVKDKETCRYLDLAKKMNITAAYPDKKLMPSRNITRAEVVYFALKLFPSKITSGAIRKTFTDVGTGHWAYASITLAAQLRMMAGFPDGAFRPDQEAKHNEILIFLHDLVKLAKQSTRKGEEPAAAGQAGASATGGLMLVWSSRMNSQGNVVAPGSPIPVGVDIVNADGKKVTLAWSASAGTLTDGQNTTAIWTPPAAEGEYTITVTATGQKGVSTSVTERFIVSMMAMEAEFKFGDQANFVNSEEFDIDSDVDGLMDAEETLLGTDPHKQDTDGDGLSDYFEAKEYGTSPLSSDTDSDGVRDGQICDSQNYDTIGCKKSS